MPAGATRIGAGTLTDGTDGVDTVGARTGGGAGRCTGAGAGVGTGDGSGVGLGIETVGTVGVVSDGVETVGVGTEGVDTVGVGTVTVDTATMVGTVRAGLECGCMPSTSNASATRTPPRATLTGTRRKRPGRPVSRARKPLQPPVMPSQTYPFLMVANRPQWDPMTVVRL